jgi:hypothetical protein
VKVVARVTRGGKPLAQGKAELVTLEGGEIIVLRSGRVTDGRLSLSAELGPVWGLRVDGLAVLAAPLGTSKGATLDLGEIALLPTPLALAAFHASDGRVHGVPSGLAPRVASERSAAPVAARATTVGASVGATAGAVAADATTIAAADTADTGKVALSMGKLLGSVAEQLRTSAVVESGFQLGAASVKIKGVPTTATDALGLILPSTADITSGGAGMSEVSFDLRPSVEGARPDKPSDPSGPVVPEVVGYSRELALRKLSALGYLLQVRSEIVSDAGLEGRVVRQIPKAGTVTAAGSVVSLFVAKPAESK